MFGIPEEVGPNYTGIPLFGGLCWGCLIFINSQVVLGRLTLACTRTLDNKRVG